ncbi:Bardet-Biedl syndrome 1 protein [Agrilus planipennis]|uniref:Bardet-Biedl syndrome 1 protein n=1 Tax=Agrilus planipennis TaxID=224129 RepID=A0A1W4X9F6_AGRPL|nr:Bardet-Biedl syndrome 1 protein [Agrilus planipennis]
MEFHTSKWLEAHLERNAGLKTLPRNLILGDIFGDGDYRLILVDVDFGQDLKANLKVYRGTGLVANQPLPVLPSSLISFYNDLTEPYLPVVGVSCDTDFLIYKNNKPFYKFSVPSFPLTTTESNVWQRLPHVTDESDYKILLEKLQSVSFSTLSSRSQKLLSVPLNNIKEEIDKYSGEEPSIHPSITCSTTLRKNSEDDIAVSCAVIGTENGYIFILDPLTFTVLHKAVSANIKSSPFILQTSGLYDVEFRILVICRENHVCVIRNGWTEGKILFRTANAIIDAVHLSVDKSLVVATAGKNLSCYSKKGNKMWTVKTIHEITCLCLLSLKSSNTYLVGVGMRNGAIHLFQGRHIVDCISAPDTPSALLFGQMGQEEHVLIIITIAGALNFKILKRTANFNLESQETSGPVVENRPLPLPKRSKLFVEQVMREKQNACDIHQRFQQDLIKMRLTAARAMVHLKPDENAAGNEKELVKLSARVTGLGPTFTLILNVENMSNEKPLLGLSAILHCKTSLYKLSSYVIKKMETKVLEINEPIKGDNSDKNNLIRVFVIKKDGNQPVITASINMPDTDFLDIL